MCRTYTPTCISIASSKCIFYSIFLLSRQQTHGLGPWIHQLYNILPLTGGWGKHSHAYYIFNTASLVFIAAQSTFSQNYMQVNVIQQLCSWHRIMMSFDIISNGTAVHFGCVHDIFHYNETSPVIHIQHILF